MGNGQLAIIKEEEKSFPVAKLVPRSAGLIL
jgi:hypothetical protein